MGLGLIGGSIARALTERGWHVTGDDHDPLRCSEADAFGFIGEIGLDPNAEITFVATPVLTLVDQVKRALAETAGVVTDVGSVKAALVAAIDDPRFVGGHPMAGSELEGLDGSDASMFEGAVWVLTPSAATADTTFSAVAAVVADLGADVVALTAERHDQTVAVISHVPHLTAATLMGLASDRAEEHAALLRLAAGGFRDMTRIASGQPSIWLDICAENRDAILSALDSRFAAVREEAEKDRAQLDDAGKAKLRRTLLDRSTQYPAAVMRLIEEGFAAEEAPEDSWRLFFAALQLVEERPKPSIGEKILRWLEDNGDFERLLTRSQATTEMRLKVRVLLRQWRSSDRYLFPALDAIARCGLGEEKQWVLDHRQKKTDKLFSQVGEQADDFDVPVMTRATYARMQHEVETLERELRTTIPQTIQRARELGDLKENAEYHSAKQKQANVQKQVASLTLRLTRARFVEDADYKEGVVGLGTEVQLVAQGDRLSYWILGDGEQHLGENVISFQAPIGKQLVGRNVGDELELGEGVARRRYRVESIARRLPPADAATPSAS